MFYAENINYRDANVIFYINIEDNMTRYDEYSSVDRQNAFPTKDSYNRTTKNSDKTNYLYSDFSTKDIDQYILITIESSKKGRIGFLTTFYLPKGVTTLRPNSEEMFFLQKGDNSTFTIRGNDSYYVEFVLIDGEGTIKYDEGTPVKLSLEEGTTVSFIIPKGKPTFSNCALQAGDDTYFAFYVRYKLRAIDKKDNIDMINYLDTNYINYDESYLLPISYYIPIYSNEQDASISIWFANMETKDSSIAEESFVIDGGVVNTDFIRARKMNPSTPLPTDTKNQLLRLINFPVLSKLNFRKMI